MILPIILWAWNTDLNVWTKDTMPVSYDVVVPNDSELFFTVRTTLFNDTGYIHTYTTSDYDASWNYLQGSAGYAPGGADALPMDIAYFADTLYIPYFF